jgi:DNA-binding MarR family transcriptional regulator
MSSIMKEKKSMSTSTPLSLFHASLLEFLMTAKHGLIEVAKGYDLTPLQAITIILIDANKPKPMNAFQKLYSCDASNITGIVDGLEEKALVKRSELTGDRRVKIVLLTSKGVKLRKILIASFVQVDDSLLKNLTKTELAAFKAIIIKLSSNSVL